MPVARLPVGWGPLSFVVVFAAMVALVDAVLGVRLYPDHAFAIAAYPVLGLAFVVVGAVAWQRRPLNRTGLLLCATGGWVLASGFGNIDDPFLLPLGLLLGQVPIAATLHLVLAFPSGVLTSRVDRVMVAAGYLLTLVLQLPAAFAALADWTPVTDVLGIVAIAVIVAASLRQLTLRVRRGSYRTRERRVLLAVYGFGIGLLLFFPISARLLVPLFSLDPFQLFLLQILVFALTPFVFAVGLLRGGFARTAGPAEFLAWLSAPERSTDLREALAQLLGDPSLEIRPGADPGDDDDARGRVVVPVADGSTPAATLVYDRSLIADPEVVQQAGRLATVALERERLVADLLAEREALRASRQRVVQVGDEQRRRLAQDLHDVVASRLSLAAFRAGRLAATAATTDTAEDEAVVLRDDLTDLIAQFRQVVHGVMPAMLVERGLNAAVEDLLDRCPVPVRSRVDDVGDLPAPVATTAYLILTEAVANVVRHAAAHELTVEVTRGDEHLHLLVADDGVGGARFTGAGLRGIADRVDVLEGRLTLDSPGGAGTRLEVSLPCGS